MRVGLYFGSFNPIHMGHLVIADQMAGLGQLDEVWLVVTPQNPLKNKRGLLDEYQRLEMVNLAIKDNPRLKACDAEFYLPRPSFTMHTLAYLEEKHPDYEFSLIMGSDTVNTLPKWKNYEELISRYTVFAYPRPGKEITFQFDTLKPLSVPMMEISASMIRRQIKNGRSVNYLLPRAVKEYIDKWGFYQ